MIVYYDLNSKVSCEILDLSIDIIVFCSLTLCIIIVVCAQGLRRNEI